MHIMKRIFLVVGFAMIVTGCTDFTPAVQNPEVHDAELQAEIQKQEQLQAEYRHNHPNVKPEDATPIYNSLLEYDAFFTSTSEKLLRSASDLCQHTMYRMGFLADTSIESDVPKKYMETPKVYMVTDTFPAQIAGIQKGDAIIQINNASIFTNDAFIKAYKASYTQPTNTVTYYSVAEKTKKTVAISGAKTCQMEIITSGDDVLNAMADGNTIYMYPALYDFLEKQQYITAVIAHEIAHNIMSHSKRGQDTTVNTAVITGLGLLLAKNVFDQDISNEQILQGAAAAGAIARLYYSPTLESEADYVGIYLMARAGYNIDGVEETWRRMSLLNPDGTSLHDKFLGTHPSTPKRFVALRKTIDEIQEKLKTESKETVTPIFTNQSLETIKSKQKPLF